MTVSEMFLISFFLVKFCYRILFLKRVRNYSCIKTIIVTPSSLAVDIFPIVLLHCLISVAWVKRLVFCLSLLACFAAVCSSWKWSDSVVKSRD